MDLARDRRLYRCRSLQDISDADGNSGRARAKAQNDAQRPLPVMAVAARKADRMSPRGLGTVIPVNTVTVRCQVSGQLLWVHFKEGRS